MVKKSDKDLSLVNAAKLLMFKQGFNLTTLHDIAMAADVPLGNVYYYFRTKEMLGKAVLDLLFKELVQWLASIDTKPTALAKLTAYIDQMMADASLTVQYGDKLGSLCQELAKQSGILADISSDLMRYSIEWLQIQFTELGYNDAKLQAYLFMARIQGMTLLASTFKDASYLQIAGNWLKTDLAAKNDTLELEQVNVAC